MVLAFKMAQIGLANYGNKRRRDLSLKGCSSEYNHGRCNIYHDFSIPEANVNTKRHKFSLCMVFFNLRSVLEHWSNSKKED